MSVYEVTTYRFFCDGECCHEIEHGDGECDLPDGWTDAEGELNTTLHYCRKCTEERANGASDGLRRSSNR